jgi:hypothetical protein
VLSDRKVPPTDDELAFAQGRKSIPPEVATEYLVKLEQINQNVKEMFEKQAAATEVCFALI